jgi:AraC-like DNA-binding protein
MTQHILYRPRAPLDSVLDFIWISERYQAESPRERVLPSGCLALIINLGDEPLAMYTRDDATHATHFSTGVVCGARDRPFIVGTATLPSTIGVAFKAGSARPFLGFPVGALQQEAVSIDALWSSGVSTLRERLLEAPSNEARAQLLEDALLERARGPLTPPPALLASLAAFEEPDLSSVAEVGQRTGLSPKQLLALFHDNVGLSPKAFWRVRRFRAALRALERGEGTGAALAADYGYCDQAHLIREFRSIAGSSPREYLATRVAGTDHVSLHG